MDYTEPKKRDFLAISTISLLGSCETKLYNAMFRPREVTKRMVAGIASHERLVERLPKVSKYEMIEKIRSGEACAFREVSVFDRKLGMIGRIDEIRFEEGFADGKRHGTLIDDKFTKIAYNAIPLYYKLQLASYAQAVDNSTDFSSICAIDKAVLICRNAETKEIDSTLEANAEELSAWKSNVPEATAGAWRVYRKEKQAEHRRFDVSNGEWVGCYCSNMQENTNSFKYM